MSKFNNIAFNLTALVGAKHDVYAHKRIRRLLGHYSGYRLFIGNMGATLMEKILGNNQKAIIISQW